MRKVELSLKEKEKDELKNEIEALYTSKYFNCNYTQFTEQLAERENIFLSIPEVGQVLRERYILSPRARKITKKNVKKKFKLMLAYIFGLVILKQPYMLLQMTLLATLLLHISIIKRL